MTSESIILAPSGKGELSERYRLVRKAHERRKRNEARREYAKTAALCLSGMLIIGLGFENYYLARKSETVHTVYAVIRDDGTLVNSERFIDVASNLQKNNNELNSLWTYVNSRECFDSVKVAEEYYIAQAMSDTRVAREFRDWFNKNNPESPQVLYGARGINIICKLESIAPSGDHDGYTIRFYRTEVSERGAKPPVLYTASLRYRTGIYPSDPARGWVDKVTFNASGVQVWEYTRAHPAGIGPVAQAGVSQ